MRAENLSWSFTEHPHPDGGEMTEKELAALDEAWEQETETGNYCEPILQAGFDIYKARYPAFSLIADDHAGFSAWKRHTVTSGIRSTHGCVVNDIYVKLIRSTVGLPKDDLIFCGKYTREPASPEEEKFVAYMDELVDYAQLGSPDAISNLLVVNSDRPPVMLNTDVEYFLRKALVQSDAYEWKWDTSHLEPWLANERIEFINEAINTHDLNAVLQTIPSCAE